MNFPIQNEADYRAALKVVSALVDADPKRGTPDADRLEVLGTLVEAYEAQHCRGFLGRVDHERKRDGTRATPSRR